MSEPWKPSIDRERELRDRIAELEAAALLVVQTSGNWIKENQHIDAMNKLAALLGGGENG